METSINVCICVRVGASIHMCNYIFKSGFRWRPHVHSQVRVRSQRAQRIVISRVTRIANMCVIVSMYYLYGTHYIIIVIYYYCCGGSTQRMIESRSRGFCHERADTFNSLAENGVDDDRLRAFLDHGADTCNWLAENC